MGTGGDVVEVLTAAGIGLDYGTVRLERATSDWLAAGAHLQRHLAATVPAPAVAVEYIGSSSVRGLLAKPIVDIAIGVAAGAALDPVDEALRADRWIYRGDAGDEGGHVWVLEAHEWHRVAHIHVVDHGSAQWRNYLRFRQLLDGSAEARRDYEAVKAELAVTHRDDRTAYTAGKATVVRRLLSRGAEG
ncbi:MAG: GrpB family protein [Actinomycetota bacterium]